MDRYGSNPSKQAKLVTAVHQAVSTIDGFRAALIAMCYQMESNPHLTGWVILTRPSISKERLNEEWGLAKRTIRPRVFRRVSLYMVRGDEIIGWPDNPIISDQEGIRAAVAAIPIPIGHRLPRPDYAAVILRQLLNHRLSVGEPMTAKQLGELAGCSYPTVAAALAKLEPVLSRLKDRRFQLNEFPRKHWEGLIVNSDRVRNSLRFKDVSGQQTTVEFLFTRFKKLKRPDLALGGAHGARRLFPPLDIVGAARLDVHVHAPDSTTDLSFVQNLNPALEQQKLQTGPCQLAVHFERSAVPMFELAQGIHWASPVDCLLDLHDVHFDDQGRELLAALEKQRPKRAYFAKSLSNRRVDSILQAQPAAGARVFDDEIPEPGED